MSDDSYAIDITILDTTTGERVTYRDEDGGYEDPDNPGEFADFIWREGNFSCDCNRSLFFRLAKGEDVDTMDATCGDGRYVVEQIVRVSNGEVVYREPAEPPLTSSVLHL